jgi:hypothetical protein
VWVLDGWTRFWGPFGVHSLVRPPFTAATTICIMWWTRTCAATEATLPPRIGDLTAPGKPYPGLSCLSSQARLSRDYRPHSFIKKVSNNGVLEMGTAYKGWLGQPTKRHLLVTCPTNICNDEHPRYSVCACVCLCACVCVCVSRYRGVTWPSLSLILPPTCPSVHPSIRPCVRACVRVRACKTLKSIAHGEQSARGPRVARCTAMTARLHACDAPAMVLHDSTELLHGRLSSSPANDVPTV